MSLAHPRNDWLRFLLVGTAVSTGAYLVAGGLAYWLLTKPLYVGPDATFAQFLRSESEPESWAHTMRWMYPVLVVRSLLLALVLLPYREALRRLTLVQRTAALAALFFVALHLAAAAPSPSNLEGFVYLRPQFLTLRAFLLTQPEMVLQALLAGFGIAKWGLRSPRPTDAVADTTATPGLPAHP